MRLTRGRLFQGNPSALDIFAASAGVSETKLLFRRNRKKRRAPTHCLPMPKSRRRKPKKNRPPTTAAPKKRLDSFSTAQQVPPLSTEPLQEPPSVTAPRQEKPASQIKQTAKRLADWWQRAWRWMRSSG